MVEIENRLSALIGPVVEAAGFELVRIRLSGQTRKTLQVMAERPDKSMTAGDCAILSRAISAVLDEADPIKDAYSLEVSSPGIDRPLIRLKDFHDWQGYQAKLELDRIAEGRKRFSGVLGGIDGENVILDIDGETSAAVIPFSWIANARLVLTDDLIRQSLAAAKAVKKARDEADAADVTEIALHPDGEPA